MGGVGFLAKEDRRYAYKGEVARGGMGQILRVWDRNLNPTLAMKFIREEEGSDPTQKTPTASRQRLDRFLEEAPVTAQFDHPLLVAYLGRLRRKPAFSEEC